MFFYKVEGHMPKLSSFGRGKTIRPKKSLTSFLHTALQLLVCRKGTTHLFTETLKELPHITSSISVYTCRMVVM